MVRLCEQPKSGVHVYAKSKICLGHLMQKIINNKYKYLVYKSCAYDWIL